MFSHASGQSQSSRSSDDKVKAYVEEFRRDVELRFNTSKVNNLYKFPRKPKPESVRRRDEESSSDSLKNVRFYDLESQNVKRDLLLARQHTPARPDAEILAEIVHKLGKLDSRYLSSQF